MLRQYHAQTCRALTLADGRTVRVGTVPVGTIVRVAGDTLMVVRRLRSGGTGLLNEHTLLRAIEEGAERMVGKGRARNRRAA